MEQLIKQSHIDQMLPFLKDRQLNSFWQGRGLFHPWVDLYSGIRCPILLLPADSCHHHQQLVRRREKQVGQIVNMDAAVTSFHIEHSAWMVYLDIAHFDIHLSISSKSLCSIQRERLG